MSRKPLGFFSSLLPLTQSHSRKQDSGPCSLPAGLVMRPCFLCLSFATNERGGIGFSQGFCGLAFIPAGWTTSVSEHHTRLFFPPAAVEGHGLECGEGWWERRRVFCPELHGASAVQGARLLEMSYSLALLCTPPAWALLSRNPLICQKVSEVHTPTALFWSISPSLWGRQWAASRAESEWHC